jgi:hypothetical protein
MREYEIMDNRNNIFYTVGCKPFIEIFIKKKTKKGA